MIGSNRTLSGILSQGSITATTNTILECYSMTSLVISISTVTNGPWILTGTILIWSRNLSVYLTIGNVTFSYH